ncbi:MAG: hypothetical protein ACQEVA_17020 [Myxococcota bacterium]
MYIAYHHYPLGPGVLWALDTQTLWTDPVPERDNPWNRADPENHDGLEWRRSYGESGGWSTPVLSENGRLYEAMGGIGALDPDTGEQIWRFGERTMASAPTILSDGTIVVGQGITGRVFFLQEDTPNGGLADEAWPTALHDHYHSNSAAHPFKWDRTGDPPYPAVDELLADTPPCWNEVDWDADECGPLPDPTDRDGDAGSTDAGDAGPVADADEGRAEDTDDAPRPTPPVREGCDGCSMGLTDRPGTPLTLCMVALLWVVCRRRGCL